MNEIMKTMYPSGHHPNYFLAILALGNMMHTHTHTHTQHTHTQHTHTHTQDDYLKSLTFRLLLYDIYLDSYYIC